MHACVSASLFVRCCCRVVCCESLCEVFEEIRIEWHIEAMEGGEGGGREQREMTVECNAMRLKESILRDRCCCYVVCVDVGVQSDVFVLHASGGAARRSARRV